MKVVSTSFLVLLFVQPSTALRSCSRSRSRRVLLAGVAITWAGPRRAASAARVDGQRLQLENAELETSPLIEELKKRTEANKSKNDATVQAVTNSMGNVYDPNLTLVRYPDYPGATPSTKMLKPADIKALRAGGFELDCPPTAGMACGLKRGPGPPATPLPATPPATVYSLEPRSTHVRK